MPVVPGYDNLKVDSTTQSGGQFTDDMTPDLAETGGRQLAAYGAGAEKEGDAKVGIQLDANDLANQLKVKDSMNDVRQKALDLTYGSGDPDDPAGYQTLKGKDAVDQTTADGTPIALADKYGNMLNDHINNVSDTLTNPDQQRMFAEQTSDLMTSFKGDAENHMMNEYKDYHVSVNNGATDLATQHAALLGITNPDATNAAIGQVKAATYANQQFNGQSADEVQATINKQVSAIHASAIESGLANNDISGAAQWFAQNKGNMVSDDLLRTQNQLNTKVDAFNAMHAVGQSMQKYQSSFTPGAGDQLTNLMFGQESGGKQFGGAGSVAGPNDPTTSAKGAIGVAQVMPGTGPEAAKLAGLPWDEDRYKNDADYNRQLGTAYMGQQLKTFGDVSKALAAYNAGPGAVNEAITEAQADKDPNWLQYMPTETQNYVTKITQQYEGGQGVPALPTENQFVNDAIGRLGDNPRTEAVAAARESAEKQYDMAIKSRGEQADQAQGRVQAELAQNGGSMTNLSPQSQDDIKLINRYDPSKGADVLKYARYAKADDAPVTNSDAFTNAVTYPDELAKMPDPVFENFLKTNFSQPDQEKIAVLRANAINGKTSDSSTSINTQAVNNALNTRLGTLGITGKNKDAGDTPQRVSAMKMYVIDSIYKNQADLGRKMTPDEVNGYVGNLFQQSVHLPGIFGGQDEQLMNTGIGDVPSKDKQGIVDTFKKHGINAPSDSDVLEAWWRNKRANQ